MAYNKKSSDTKLPPVGSIIAWAKSLSGTPALPVGWVECNGQTLSDTSSVYNGLAMPALNNTNRFLRGASTSGGSGGSTSHTHGGSVSTDHLYFSSSLYTFGPNQTVPVDATLMSTTAYVASLSHYHFISATEFAHSHTAYLSVNYTDHLPLYYNVVYIMRVK